MAFCYLPGRFVSAHFLFFRLGVKFIPLVLQPRERGQRLRWLIVIFSQAVFFYGRCRKLFAMEYIRKIV